MISQKKGLNLVHRAAEDFVWQLKVVPLQLACLKDVLQNHDQIFKASMESKANFSYADTKVLSNHSLISHFPQQCKFIRSLPST